MKINIDTSEIAEQAAWEYRADGDTELHAAPMVDITDYSAAAVDHFMDHLWHEIRDQIIDEVEQAVQDNG